MKNRKSIGLLCVFALAAAFASEVGAQGSRDGQAAATGTGKAPAAAAATQKLQDVSPESFVDCAHN